MTNKQIIILRKFREVIKEIGRFNFVGFYENFDDFKRASSDQNSPAVLLQDSDELPVDDQEPQLIRKLYQIRVWFYRYIGKNETQTLLDDQAAIEDAIMDNSTLTELGDDALCISWAGCQKGDELDVFNYRNVGFLENWHARVITFNVLYRTER